MALTVTTNSTQGSPILIGNAKRGTLYEGVVTGCVYVVSQQGDVINLTDNCHVLTNYEVQVRLLPQGFSITITQD